MLLPAVDFQAFLQAEVEKAVAAFGFQDKVELLAAVAFQEDCPVWVVGADGGVDFEAAGDFEEEFYIGVVVQGDGGFREGRTGVEGDPRNTVARTQIPLGILP